MQDPVQITVSIYKRLQNLELSDKSLKLPEGVRIFDEVNNEQFKDIVRKSKLTSETTFKEMRIILKVIE